MQRKNNDGGRDGSGRFGKGNSFGFERGKSGNPAGRPRSALLTDALRKQLSESGDLERIASSLISKAKKGDMEATKIIFDRLEGKPKQFIEADLNVSQDWKTYAETYNLSIDEILVEAKRLLTDGSDDDDDERTIN
jgi:hypothetical protein